MTNPTGSVSDIVERLRAETVLCPDCLGDGVDLDEIIPDGDGRFGECLKCGGRGRVPTQALYAEAADHIESLERERDVALALVKGSHKARALQAAEYRALKAEARIAELEAALAGERDKVLVPREPTEAMRKAFFRAWLSSTRDEGLEPAYAAMLEAVEAK